MNMELEQDHFDKLGYGKFLIPMRATIPYEIPKAPTWWQKVKKKISKIFKGK